MNSKNDNIEFMIHDNADEVIEELSESLLNRYQIRLEKSREVVILFLIMFIYCTTNVIK